MPNLPNPFTDSGEPVAPSPGEAAALTRSHAPSAAADIPEPTTDGGGPQESSAVEDRNPDTAGDLGIDCIAQIFVGARKLEPVEMWFENTAYPREDELLYEVLLAMDDPNAPDLIEMPYGMAGLFDPPPLFLQQKRA